MQLLLACHANLCFRESPPHHSLSIIVLVSCDFRLLCIWQSITFQFAMWYLYELMLSSNVIVSMVWLIKAYDSSIPRLSPIPLSPVPFPGSPLFHSQALPCSIPRLSPVPFPASPLFHSQAPPVSFPGSPLFHSQPLPCSIPRSHRFHTQPLPCSIPRFHRFHSQAPPCSIPRLHLCMNNNLICWAYKSYSFTPHACYQLPNDLANKLVQHTPPLPHMPGGWLTLHIDAWMECVHILFGL